MLTESITPQIIIKEQVKVLPQSNNYTPDDPTQSHTITAIVEWDTTGGTHNFLRARMNMINECTGDIMLSDYFYDGQIEISMSSTDAVRYEINTFTEAKDPPPNQSWSPFIFSHSLKVYADDVLIDEEPTFHNYGSTSIYYWRSNLKIKIASYVWNNYEYALCLGEKAIIDVWAEEDCQSPLWNAFEGIQVSIVEGGEHTSFYYAGDLLIGDNVTFSTDVHGNYFSSYGDIELKYDVEYTDATTDKLVILEAVVNGITARDTIIIPKPEGYFLNGEIEDGKERIVKWERLRINSWIEKGGMCEGITSPPEGTTFGAEIIQGAQFGGLVDTTTGGTTQMLTGLTADENNIVRIEYFANGDSAVTDEEIIVKISSTMAAVDPLEITFFASRSEIVVTTSPGELQAGEISDVFVYWYDEMDSLVLIPSDISLKVEIIEGAGLGDIYDPATGQYADYFDEIYQGFKFKAAEGIDTSNAQVLIKVSGIVGGGITSPQGQGGKLEEKIISNEDRKKVEGRDPNFSFMEIYGIGFVVVGDECDDEILVCNNYQPPRFEDVSTITVLGENDPWQWIDSQGTMQTISSINGCNIIEPGDFGITYIMNAIGDPAISQQPIYYRLDDMKVTACADKSNPNPIDQVWRFSVENMRVPIFRDHCDSWAITNSYKDLLDGANADTLAKYITNCTDYNNVLEALDWWKNGTYYQTIPLPYLYYFSAGVIAHENIHVKQIKDGGTKAFSISALSQVMNGSDGLPKLTKYDKFSLNVYKCPEDVLNALWGRGSKVIKLKEQIRNELSNALEIASKLKPLGGVDGQLRYKSELEADELARPKYDEIKENINNWAKQQSWWCNETVSSYFNCYGKTCIP